MFAIEHKKVCGIFLSWDLFFYPRRVCSTVFTQQQHQQRNVYKKLDTLRALFYVTFNNFNDFFHGNSLLIKMQTFKMKTHSFCVLFILSIDFILLLICKKKNFFLLLPSVEMLLTSISSLLCIHLHFWASVLWQSRRCKWNKMCKKEAGSLGP